MKNKHISCLTVAGSDSSGGAGIQADLKTFMALNVYGASVITAITAQNTKEVAVAKSCSWKIIQAQLNAVLSDLNVKSIKIGMLANASITQNIANYFQKNNKYKIILDPVIYSKSNFCLLKRNAIQTLKNKLIPCAFLITPNKKELEALLEEKIADNITDSDLNEKLKKIKCPNILVKGGHFHKNKTIVIDKLFIKNQLIKISSKRHNQNYTHGTGCSLSSAISANISLNNDLTSAVKKAISFVNQGILNGIKIGDGINPINHNYKNQ